MVTLDATYREIDEKTRRWGASQVAMKRMDTGRSGDLFFSQSSMRATRLSFCVAFPLPHGVILVSLKRTIAETIAWGRTLSNRRSHSNHHIYGCHTSPPPPRRPTIQTFCRHYAELILRFQREVQTELRRLAKEGKAQAELEENLRDKIASQTVKNPRASLAESSRDVSVRAPWARRRGLPGPPLPLRRKLDGSTAPTYFLEFSSGFYLSTLAGIVVQAEAAAKEVEFAAERKQFRMLRQEDDAKFEDIKHNLVEESRRVLEVAAGDAKQASEAAELGRWDETIDFPDFLMWRPEKAGGELALTQTLSRQNVSRCPRGWNAASVVSPRSGALLLWTGRALLKH